MTTAPSPEENPYEGSGAGGKFRKRPFRRSQTTPYDRPPTALRNPSRNNGWLSKIVDPAQRLITSSAHSLFASVFRKRLLPPPHPPSSDAGREMMDDHQEEATFVANDSSGEQQGAVGERDVQINCSDGGGLTELEKLLRQKTFTRSEIDHLTALMHSRTVDLPAREEEKATEVVPSEPMLPCEQKEEYPKIPAPENGIENHLVLTPYVNSSVPNEDVASPAELAKAYMGSRPSKVSPSMLGLRSPALNEDPTLLKGQNFPLKSPIMSIVPRASRHAGIHENGFVTPRSRGRSAIYSMAQTPYARIYPTSTLKGVEHAVEGEPSSLTQSGLNHDMPSGSKRGALKRRSSVLDNDIGSVGPIRRIRQKSNLLYSKGSNLPLSSSSLSIVRSGVGDDASQQPSSCMQKRILLDEVKHSHMKLSTENVDDTIRNVSFPPLPSKSSEMASKILQQLDKLVSPKEKSSELRLRTVDDKSPSKLSPSMLRGQALRSMETVDSSKFLDNVQDSNLDGTLGNLTASAPKLTSQIDKVENGPLKLVAPSDGLVPVVTDADAPIPRNQLISSEKSMDFSMTKSVSYPPQKKRAFHMSAHEDYLDLDDDAYPNGAVSSFSSAEKEATSSTPMAEKATSGTEAIAQEMPPALSVVNPSKSFTIDGKTSVETADRSMAGQVDVSTSITSSIPDPTFKPFTAATQTIFGSNKPASPNRSISNLPLFNFGNKVVSSTEVTAADAPSKESMESDRIFGLEKVVSSKEPAVDAPLVNFGTDNNVGKVPQMSFNSSSSVSGESCLKFGAVSDSKLGSSISSTTVTGATDSMPKVLELDNADAKTNIATEFSVRSSETAVSSAASTSLLTSPASIFTFGHSSNQNNGPLATSPSFSSPFPPLVTNALGTQNMFSSPSLAASSSISAAAVSTSTSLTASTPIIIASSNSSSSTPMVASLSSTASFFKFGSSSVPSTGLPVSSTSGSEPVETKNSQDAGVGNLSSTAFGSSSSVGSTGSGIFAFGSSAMTTVNSQSQGPVSGTSSGSVPDAPASPAIGGFATSTQSQSVPFGSSASSPLFGLTGNAAFSSGSSTFPSSSPATGTTFGLNTSVSSTAANAVSSNSGTSSTLIGLSSWQPSKSPFSSAFNSSSSSGFSFGTSTASVASTSSPVMFISSNSGTSSQFSFTSASTTTSTQPASFSFTSAAATTFTQPASQFSFTSAAATTSKQPASQFSFTSAAANTSTQPSFGSANPAFAFGSASVNNDQMSMEDSMAEDTVQATPPATPIFGQQPAPLQSNFVFGPTPSGASPFQFGSQQNIAQQNPSPFQASGSLDFNAGGGSFSLGTGGGDKSGRKFVKVKHKQRKK